MEPLILILVIGLFFSLFICTISGIIVSNSKKYEDKKGKGFLIGFFISLLVIFILFVLGILLLIGILANSCKLF